MCRGSGHGVQQGVGRASSHLSDGASRAWETSPGGTASVKALFCLQMLILLDSKSFLSSTGPRDNKTENLQHIIWHFTGMVGSQNFVLPDKAQIILSK